MRQVRFVNFIFFDFRLAKHHFGIYDGLKPVPPLPAVDAFQRAFPAAHRDPFAAVEGVDGSRFVGQTAERERVERDLGFRGMDEALAGDFLVHDASFEVNDAHAIPVGVEGGLLQQVEFGSGGERGGGLRI